MKAINKIKKYSVLLFSISFIIALSSRCFPLYAATITVVNSDGPGEGFNDPAAWTPVGGNPATTTGSARLNAFQFAADIWGDFLESDVEILVDATFDPKACNAFSAILGSAGAAVWARDFSGAPIAGTYYPIALANALYGSDLYPGDDINASFNSSIDNNDACLTGTDWYYGYDGNGNGDIDFVTVVLHELAHGLGFQTVMNINTGDKLNGFDDIYMFSLEHHGASPSDYPSMSNAQRAAGNISETGLHWVGANVRSASSTLTNGKTGDHVWMYAPNPVEPGSSVSHWSKTCTPNQLMEPSYTGIMHGPGLELELFKDIGWGVNPTFLEIVNFNAIAIEDHVLVQWETSSENRTVGFYLYRSDEVTGKYNELHNGFLPGLIHSPQGGIYRFVDEDALPGKTYTYYLVEVERTGKKKTYGPFTVTADLKDTGLKSSNTSQVFQKDTGSGHGKKLPQMTRYKKASPRVVKSARKATENASREVQKRTGTRYSKNVRPITIEQKARLAAMKSARKATANAYQEIQKDIGTRYSENVHPMTRGKNTKRDAMESAIESNQSCNAGDTIKISIGQNALYYLDAAEISDVMGMPVRLVMKWIRKRELTLRNQGQEVAWLAADGNIGIYFYGEAVDNIYTNKNIYLLKKAKKGKGLEMENIGGEGLEPLHEPKTFSETIHAEEDHFALTALFDDPLADYWMWDYIIAGDSEKAFNILANGVAEADTASLEVHLQGVSDTNGEPGHHAVVTLNGAVIGEGYWADAMAHKLDFDFDVDLLNDGENIIEVAGLLDTGVPYSIFYVDSFDLYYPRYYQAIDNILFLDGDKNTLITVTNLTNSDIIVFELSDPKKPKLISTIDVAEAAGGFQVSFSSEGPGAPYLVMTSDAAVSPYPLICDSSSNLKQKKNKADYLIITPAEFFSSAQSLADYRQGQGLKSMVVNPEDIMDEFNHGLYDPRSIRDFLSYAYHNWKRPPRYVVLAGGGTYDYKNRQGYGDNLVPPMMISTPYGLFASDNWYGDVDGNDMIPEIAIGRLPVLTDKELQTVIGKIMSYETASGAWTRNILMVADDPDNDGNFPASSDAIAQFIPPEYTSNKVYLSEHSIGEARQLLLDGVNEGALLLNYVGHAGLDRLAQVGRDGILLSSDVTTLENAEKLPIVTSMSCLVGRYAIPGFDSLAELLVLHQDGGAIATWASTGLSINKISETLDKTFFNVLFAEKTKIIGDALLKTYDNYPAPDKTPYMLGIYNLLGDPALRVR